MYVLDGLPSGSLRSPISSTSYLGLGHGLDPSNDRNPASPPNDRNRALSIAIAISHAPRRSRSRSRCSPTHSHVKTWCIRLASGPSHVTLLPNHRPTAAPSARDTPSASSHQPRSGQYSSTTNPHPTARNPSIAATGRSSSLTNRPIDAHRPSGPISNRPFARRRKRGHMALGNPHRKHAAYRDHRIISFHAPMS
ncbi:hypothetical protein LTR28_006313 [Elasticomyces elasticus]|nr:hypothetical protein LTR28_006313 [Elasticomyces elasticus]